MHFSKIYSKIWFFIATFLILTNCAALKPDWSKTAEPDGKKRARKNVEEGRGFSVGGIGSSNKNTNFLFASSNPMWRASLDTIDFITLANVDYAGGLIITDWYSEENQKNDFIKISIRFLTNEIRADALKIQIYTKECIADTNNCKITQNNSEIETKLKESILKKASIYKQEKKKKKN